MPPKKTKKRERPLSPNSSNSFSIVNVGKKIKTNPVPPSQSAKMPVQTSQTQIISPPFSQSSLINVPDQSEFEKINQWARQSYSVDIDSYQWIDPNLIAYGGLINISRFPLYENKLLVMKFQNENVSDEIINIMEQETIKKAYFRGPSGVGKSYTLIQTVFRIKKNFNHKYRVLHIILNDVNIDECFQWFSKDFIYCFCNDFEDHDFPKPPKENNFIYDKSIKKGENWLKFFKNREHQTVKFLEPIQDYLTKKNLKMILIWDQDNVYHKHKLQGSNFEFLESMRKSSLFSLKLFSASNDNEGFQNLNRQLGFTILETNMGFSKENMISFIKILMAKRNINYEIDTELIFDLTNGNGYLVSRFMQTEGKNFQEKLQTFLTKISSEMDSKVEQFFQVKLSKSKLQWKNLFPKILKFIDQEEIISDTLQLHIDKNFTYVDKNGYLKSTCSLAKKIFVNNYLRNLNLYDDDDKISREMWNDIETLTNNVMKRWVFKNFVIMKFHSKLGQEFTIECLEKISRGQFSDKPFLLTIKIEQLKFFSTFKEINDITKGSNNVLLTTDNERNEFFDFLFWDGKQKILHVFQITINESHSPSDSFFFSDGNLKNYHSIKKTQIKFYWITLKKRCLKCIRRIGSFLINFEEKTIKKNYNEKMII